MRGNIDRNRVLTLLGEARHALGQLTRYQVFSNDEILSSDDRLGNLKYQWVILMEACVDICNHFSARLFGKTPESYAGCFEIIQDFGVIDKKLAAEMAELARFRNVLVHLYWKVDNKLVVEHTRNRLEVVERYLKEIAKQIQ